MSVGIDDMDLYGPAVNPRENVGLEFPWMDQNAILVDLSAVAFPFYINFAPLVSRLRQVPAGQVAFTQFGHAMRPNEFLLMASITTTSATFTVDDASIFMNGDVLELPTGEHVEVAGDPNTTANTIPVTRGMEGTPPAAVTVVTGSEPRCYLIGNSRTGGEKNQHGLFPNSWVSTNYVQTAEHPVEVAGIFQDTANWVNELRAASPMDFGRMHQLTNMIQGFERAFIYGLGADPRVETTKRAKTKGILKRLSEVNNVKTPSSADAAAYTPEMLFRDLWSNINGFQNLLVMSPDWRIALTTWKIGISVLQMERTEYNMDIELFTIPTFGSQAVIFDPQLRKGTAMALREEDLTLRYMRLPSWYPRGKQGDTWEGDLIARMGIQVDNPELQSAVVGVTAFAKS